MFLGAVQVVPCPGKQDLPTQDTEAEAANSSTQRRARLCLTASLSRRSSWNPLGKMLLLRLFHQEITFLDPAAQAKNSPRKGCC